MSSGIETALGEIAEGLLRASARTCRLISLVGVKLSCLRIDKQAFPPVWEERTPRQLFEGQRWERTLGAYMLFWARPICI